MTASDRDYVAHYFDESLNAMTEFSANPATRDTLFVMAEAVCAALRQGGKLLLAGNGGSAADAQHIAAEFTGRLMYDRPPLAAIALTTDTSALTAISNDYGYEQVFERQVRALGRPGDVFLGITTSGRSPNILRALEAARALGLVTLGFAGRDDSTMRGLCDALLLVPAERASIVQQVHINAAHVLCALVERHFFPTTPDT